MDSDCALICGCVPSAKLDCLLNLAKSSTAIVESIRFQGVEASNAMFEHITEELPNDVRLGEDVGKIVLLTVLLARFEFQVGSYISVHVLKLIQVRLGQVAGGPQIETVNFLCLSYYCTFKGGRHVERITPSFLSLQMHSRILKVEMPIMPYRICSFLLRNSIINMLIYISNPQVFTKCKESLQDGWSHGDWRTFHSDYGISSSLQPSTLTPTISATLSTSIELASATSTTNSKYTSLNTASPSPSLSDSYLHTLPGEVEVIEVTRLDVSVGPSFPFRKHRPHEDVPGLEFPSRPSHGSYYDPLNCHRSTSEPALITCPYEETDMILSANSCQLWGTRERPWTR